jgi:DnaJ-class molecular chaperone
MRKRSVKPTEHKCPACDGTGFPTVKQPVKPSRKIYPVQCKNCGGKGRIAVAANRGCPYFKFAFFSGGSAAAIFGQLVQLS